MKEITGGVFVERSSSYVYTIDEFFWNVERILIL